jgi:hypothetical protein
MSPSTVIPAILGYGDMTPEEAWKYVLGELPPTPDNEFTQLGKYLEPAVLAWWEDVSGARLERDVEIVHPDYPIKGRADGISYADDGEYSVVEVKVTSARIEDELPMRWVIQGLVYAYLLSKLRSKPPASVIYTMLRWRNVPHIEEYPMTITERELAAGEYICELAKDFYNRYVVPRQAPNDWNVWEVQSGLKLILGEIDKVRPIAPEAEDTIEIVVEADYNISALLSKASELYERIRMLRELEKSFQKIRESIEASYVVPPGFVGRVVIRGAEVSARITYYTRRKIDKTKVPEEAYTYEVERRFELYHQPREVRIVDRNEESS